MPFNSHYIPHNAAEDSQELHFTNATLRDGTTMEQMIADFNEAAESYPKSPPTLTGYAAENCSHPRRYDDGTCVDCGFDPEHCTEVSTTETSIPTELYNQLNYLGLIPSTERAHNVGASNYSKQLIQPWSIWLSYPDLSAFELDIIKRILRTKSTDSRRMDYEKCQHILTELIRQLDTKEQS